jgi:hypothetical protein
MPIVNSVVIASRPSTASQSIFTGATVPITYKDNAIAYENNYEYASNTHNITITGLDGSRATIIDNGSRKVRVNFIVTSSSTSLKNFTITCVNGSETLVYNGLHAHYGTTLTGTQNLTFAYLNITKDGTEGTVGTATTGTNYRFIVSTTLPNFSSATTLYQDIYGYQVLNVLIGRATTLNFTSVLANCISFNQPLILPTTVSPNLSIGSSFLQGARSFNQPLTIGSTITSIGVNFLNNANSFNQPLTIPSGVTSIGGGFLQNGNSFNQPFTFPAGITTTPSSFLSTSQFNHPIIIPSGVTSISNGFLQNCTAFNQPLTIPSSVTSIGTNFLAGASQFNQPLTIPSSVTSIGTTFLQDSSCLSTINYNASVYPTDNNSLSQSFNSKTSTSGAGIIVYGTGRAGLITALPNRTTTPFRKLINGGS